MPFCILQFSRTMVTNVNAAAAAIAAVACLCTRSAPHVAAFVPSQPVAQIHPVSSRRTHRNPTPLASSSTDGDENDSLAEKARKAKLEAEKMEAELTLGKITNLENRVFASSSSPGTTDSSMKELQDEIEALAKLIDPKLVDAATTSAAASVSSSTNNDSAATSATREKLAVSTVEGLSSADLEAACQYYVSLPITMRSALASAVGYENMTSLTGEEVKDLVTKLYERRNNLSTVKLRELYKDTQQAPLTIEEGIQDIFAEVKTMLDDPDAALVQAVESQVPKQARQEGKCPTEADVNAFFQKACGKNTFLASEKPIRTGELYVIRGKSQKNDAASLIEALDAALQEKAPDWLERNQYCYVTDPSLIEGDEDLFGDPVLLLLNKDMAPTASKALTTGSTLAALVGSVLFCLGTFGTNQVIVDRLQEANKAGNYDLSWFNELVIPMFAALFAIQASHELGHLLIAWRDKMKVTPPTILPSTGLPYLGTLTRMKTSPKDYKSLFDFGFAGPVTGLGIAFVFFLWGLQLTVTMDPEASKYLPSVPVAFLKMSTLGGSLIDQVVGGGAGIMLQQEPETLVSLHPFAIAGFVGMIINALDLIPIGSTDGARISQAMLGRVGQTIVGGLSYVVLLGALIFSDTGDIFLSYCLINSIVQRELEVPCKNEVDRVDLDRAAAAIAAFFVSALVLVPM